MTDEHKSTIDAKAAVLIYGLSGFILGFVPMAVWISLGMYSKAAPKPEPPKAIQWIGKLAAGDGASAVFMCREIEVGLGDKGELLWRRVNVPAPQVMPLKSTPTNAEAE